MWVWNLRWQLTLWIQTILISCAIIIITRTISYVSHFRRQKKDAESIPRPQNYLAFHLFYSSTLSVTLLHLINRIADFINLLIEHSFLSLCWDLVFLKLRVRHDNTVIVTCRNPWYELLSAALFKITLLWQPGYLLTDKVLNTLMQSDR